MPWHVRGFARPCECSPQISFECSQIHTQKYESRCDWCGCSVLCSLPAMAAAMGAAPNAADDEAKSPQAALQKSFSLSECSSRTFCTSCCYLVFSCLLFTALLPLSLLHRRKLTSMERASQLLSRMSENAHGTSCPAVCVGSHLCLNALVGHPRVSCLLQRGYCQKCRALRRQVCCSCWG